MRRILLVLSLLLSAPVLFAQNVSSLESPWQFSLEGGALYQTISDVEIPPGTGTRFSLVDAVGPGPLPFVRFEAKYAINNKHRMRLLLAPLEIEAHGQLDKDVVYHGETFLADTDTLYRYKFNSYRLSYAYRFYESSMWSWDAGVTAKIRQAEIALIQGDTSSRYPNLGFVPLAHLAGAWKVNNVFSVQMDLDAIGSQYGRAIDVGLFGNYHLNKNWQLGAGYRTVEGGADVDVVYNFAWIHYFGMRVMVSI